MKHAAADDEFARLVAGLLDGELSEADAARLGQWIASDAARARQLARAALLHDAIDQELHGARQGRAAAAPLPPTRVPRRAARWWWPAAGFAAAVLAWLLLTGGPANAAALELARIVRQVRSGDRAFTIRAVDEPGAGPVPGPDPGPRLDGAELYVRGSDAYVLIRHGDAGPVVTGSDGRSAWQVPPRGPVRVSADPQRFRGALPGHQHGLPFLDPQSGFAPLAEAYDITVGTPITSEGRPVARLLGTRRADVRRGPKRVELWYEPDTATLLRMVLDRLPQAQGGPRTVELRRRESGVLPAAFFDHHAHHTPEREVLMEPRR